MFLIQWRGEQRRVLESCPHFHKYFAKRQASVPDGRWLCLGFSCVLCPWNRHVRLCVSNEDSQVRLCPGAVRANATQAKKVCHWLSTHWWRVRLQHLQTLHQGFFAHDCHCGSLSVPDAVYSQFSISGHFTIRLIFCVLTKTGFIFVLQMRLMKGIRTSIKEDRFPQFVREFLAKLFPKGDYPKWVCEALDAVNIKVKIW